MNVARIVVMAFLASAVAQTISAANEAKEEDFGIMVPTDDYNMANRSYCGISSVAVSLSGKRLWATWYASPTGDEDSNNYAILATSDDRGGHWREVLVYDPDGLGPRRAFDPEVWVSPDGKLRWMFTDRVAPLKATAKKGENGCLCDPTQDRLQMVTLDAESLPSAPYPEPVRIGRGIMMCKPIVLRNGNWLLPVAHWNEAPSACVLESTDGGKSFHELGGITLPEKERLFDEHNLLELRDGTIRAYIRTRHGPHACWQADSKDGGRTWGEPKPCTFAHCTSRVFVRRLASGAVLMVKNGPLDQDIGRRRMTAYISYDDAETWQGGLVLSEGDDPCAYPDGDQGPDGTIYLTWDGQRGTYGDVHFARFCENDVRIRRLFFEQKKNLADSKLNGLIMKKYLGVAQAFDGTVDESTTAVKIFETPVYRVTGRQMTVEADCEALQVELLDGLFRPIPGFTWADCHLVSGAGEKTVTWKECPDLSLALGRDVTVRFRLTKGELKSFAFGD